MSLHEQLVEITRRFNVAYDKARLDRARREEQTIRRLLERWVSELEPAVARGPDGEIIGLTPANAELGTTPFILRIEDL